MKGTAVIDPLKKIKKVNNDENNHSFFGIFEIINKK